MSMFMSLSENVGFLGKRINLKCKDFGFINAYLLLPNFTVFMKIVKLQLFV